MLPRYKAEFKPEFSSTAMDFKVTLKNLNYKQNLRDLVSDQVSDQVNPKDITQSILEFCVTEKTSKKYAHSLDIKILLILQESI